MADGTTVKPIPLFRPYIPPITSLMPPIRETLYSGYLATGPKVAAFEKEFGEYIQWSNVVALNSGTAALHLALILAGVGPGDEVISTPMTAEPTNLAIMYTGARVVWADVLPRSGNIDWKSVLGSITPRTKAVMMVDYSGIPAHSYDMYHVPDCIPIIEDAAHALGAAWDSQLVGTISEFTAFSFQAIKHMNNGGDGGALAIYGGDIDRTRRLRFFGIDKSKPRDAVDVSELGYKYAMNELQATIGLVQLKYASDVISSHIANAIQYEFDLREVPGLWLPLYEEGAEPTWWFFTVFAERRDDLMRKLNEAGVQAGLPHRRNDQHSIFAYAKRELPGLDWYWDHHLCLPCGWWMNENDVARVVKVIQEGW